MVALGLAVNLLLPHGWTVWPFVLAAAILLTIHEMAERNGQGIPPLHVYAFFVAAMTLWLGLVVILSAVNVLVLLLGIGVLGYFAVQGYLKQREKMRVIAARARPTSHPLRARDRPRPGLLRGLRRRPRPRPEPPAPRRLSRRRQATPRSPPLRPQARPADDLGAEKRTGAARKAASEAGSPLT